MRARSWAYLAGIMDGEGCISIHCGYGKCYHPGATFGKRYPKFALGISIYQQNVRLMKWLVYHFGGQYYRHPMKDERKDGYSWHAPTGEAGKNFLLALIPYLMLKQEQAKLALEYMRLGREYNPEKRRWLADRCAALNAGTSTTNTPDLSEFDIIPFDWILSDRKIESELAGDCKSVPVVIQ